MASNRAYDDLSREELAELAQKLSANLIRQKKQSQRILQAVPLGVLVVDGMRRIQFSNSLANQLLGYESRELKGQKLDFVFPDIGNVDLKSSNTSAMAHRKNGERFPVEIYINEYEDGLHFAHILDVSERHRLEKLRQDFLAMVSHDLRSPLSSMRLFLQMISEGAYCEVSPAFRRNLGRAESSVDLMVSLVNDLLDSEQLQSGDFKLDIRPTSTLAIVERSMAASQGAAQAARVKLESDVVNDALNADEDRLVRVLVNLTGNAIKFSPPEGTVKITAGIEGTGVAFRVIDQGPGVPEHLQKAIFERYRQLDQPAETRRHGLGLGLYICKALVEKHKGNIWVDSEVGKGSRFCFSIPMLDVNQ